MNKEDFFRYLKKTIKTILIIAIHILKFSITVFFKLLRFALFIGILLLGAVHKDYDYNPRRRL